jgi:hypothetical protein
MAGTKAAVLGLMLLLGLGDFLLLPSPPSPFPRTRARRAWARC